MANNSNSPRTTVDEQASQEVATITDKNLLAQFAEMAIGIPASDGNGTENILSQILAAPSWEALDQPWDASPIDDILGKHLKLVKAERRPSTFSGGLGMFLVIHLEDTKNGTRYVKTTGSVSVVGQVAAAYYRGWMPLLVEWCRAERPTESGYYPQHLRVLDSFAPSPADAG